MTEKGGPNVLTVVFSSQFGNDMVHDMGSRLTKEIGTACPLNIYSSNGAGKYTLRSTASRESLQKQVAEWKNDVLLLKKNLDLKKTAPLLFVGVYTENNHLLHQDLKSRNPAAFCFISKTDIKHPDSVFAVVSSFLLHFTFRLNGGGWKKKPQSRKHAPYCLNRSLEYQLGIPLSLQMNDICSDCLNGQHENLKNDGLFKRLTEILEQQRGFLLNRSALAQSQSETGICIEGPRFTIRFPQLSNKELKLTPLEKITYLLFLRHQDGMLLSEVEHHQDWMRRVYARIATTRSKQQIQKHIRQLSDSSDNSLSEKISRIRRKLQLLGGKAFAEKYAIRGGRGQVKKIRVSSDLIQTDDKAAALWMLDGQ